MAKLARTTVIVALLAVASAQANLSNLVVGSNNGLIQVSASSVTFDLSSQTVLKVARPGAYAQPTDGPFDVVAAAPLPGTWLVQLAVDPPLRLGNGVTIIPPTDLWYRIQPTSAHQAIGCVASGWTRIGAGSTVLSIHVAQGAASCRFHVWLRLSGTHIDTPGEYDGSLVWAIRRSGP